MLRALVVFGLAMLVASCATQPDGPMPRQSYPDYAEYSISRHEAPQMDQDGYNHAQQVCFMHVLLNHLPVTLTERLNDFASGKTILLASEYAKLQKETMRYAGDVSFIQWFKPELDHCLGKA